MELLSIKEIFEGRFCENNEICFRIPDYQRGYSWVKQQLKEFWEDLENIVDKHYIGVLTIRKIKKDEIDESKNNDLDMKHLFKSPFYIIDGQ